MDARLKRAALFAAPAHRLSLIGSLREVTRDLAYRQIDAQLQSSSGSDAKAIGVIAFDVDGIAVVMAAKDSFGGLWLLVVLGLLIASVACLVALWSRQFDVGPDPGTFYEDAKARSLAEANVALVTEQAGSLQANDEPCSRSRSPSL